MRVPVVVAVALLLLISCIKKNNPMPPGGLFGKWEIRRVYNGNIVPPDSVYKPGNGNILQLNADSTYVKYIQHKFSSKGVFHTRVNLLSETQMTNERLYFDNDTSFSYLVLLNGDLMTLKPLFPDIPTTDYQKIQN